MSFGHSYGLTGADLYDDTKKKLMAASPVLVVVALLSLVRPGVPVAVSRLAHCVRLSPQATPWATLDGDNAGFHTLVNHMQRLPKGTPLRSAGDGAAACVVLAIVFGVCTAWLGSAGARQWACACALVHVMLCATALGVYVDTIEQSDQRGKYTAGMYLCAMALACAIAEAVVCAHEVGFWSWCDDALTDSCSATVEACASIPRAMGRCCRCCTTARPTEAVSPLHGGARRRVGGPGRVILVARPAPRGAAAAGERKHDGAGVGELRPPDYVVRDVFTGELPPAGREPYVPSTP